jgi:hypothetical protein
VFSVQYSADAANISVATFKREAERGNVTILKLSPRRLGVRASELYRFLETRAARA